MNLQETWEDQKYNEVLDDEYRLLERRRAHDSNCTVEDIEGQLKALYIREGQNVDGRGQLGDIVMSATIAAYEAFIDNWKKEIAEKN